MMEECLQKLRKVKDGDYVLSSDVNDIIDCIHVARDWLLEICNEYGIDPKYVYELDPYLAKLRRVKYGEIIESSDHNNLVDTLFKLRDVIEDIEVKAWQDGYNEGYSSGYSKGTEHPRAVLQITLEPTGMIREIKRSLSYNLEPTGLVRRIGISLSISVQ